jgi:CRISPR-associated protein Cst2
MTTIKGSGSKTRISPVKMSPAIGLLPFEDNSNVDFLTRKHRLEDGKNSGDIVNIELNSNIYKAGISIDCLRVGHDEVIEMDEENQDEFKKQKIVFIDKTDNKSKDRVIKVLEGVNFSSDQSKQARALTDFLPDIIFISLQNKYNHRIQKIFDLDENRNLNIDRVEEILKDIGDYSKDIIFGMISGVVNNENDIKKLLKKYKIEILTPGEAIKESIKKFDS